VGARLTRQKAAFHEETKARFRAATVWPGLEQVRAIGPLRSKTWCGASETGFSRLPRFAAKLFEIVGAPEENRTPDPQIRSAPRAQRWIVRPTLRLLGV
jgi:hypothetical protein